MLRFVVLCALVAAAAAASATKQDLAAAVGARLRLCARSNPEYDECMKKRLEQLMPELAETGIPEVGVQPGEPLDLAEMSVHYDHSNMSADLRLRNVRVWGVKGLRILSVKSLVNDPEKFLFEVGYFQPRMYVEGDYKVDARLVIPIVTKGYFNLSMTDVSGVWKVTGEHYKKRGEDYVRITSFSTLPQIGDLELYASNIIPDNPDISEYILSLANEYWRPLFEVMLPDTNESWGPIIRDRMNQLFSKVPFNAMFPLE